MLIAVATSCFRGLTLIASHLRFPLFRETPFPCFIPISIMRSYIPVYVCLILAGLPALSAPISMLPVVNDNSNSTGPGPYRISVTSLPQLPQPDTQSGKVWPWPGVGPVNPLRFFGRGPSYYPERSSGKELSWLDLLKAPVEVSTRDISTDTSKELPPLFENPTQPGERIYTEPPHYPETTGPSKPITPPKHHPLDLTMILPRNTATQPGDNVEPQDIWATFLTKIKERSNILDRDTT